MTLTVGLMLPTAANTDSGIVDPPRLLEAACLAETAGFDGVYVGDHLLHPRPLLESLASLSAVAAVTRRVSIGTCVLLAALREPLWLAKQLGTICAFAPGRLRLGVGLGGEYATEFEAAGVALADRGRRTEEMVSQLRQWLQGDGPIFGDDAMRMGLRPVPASAPPILLAGWKETALRRAARIGDGWIGYLLSPESFARRRAFLLDCGAGQDRPFAAGMLLPVHFDKAPDASARAGAAWNKVTGNDAVFPERLFVAGSVQAIVEQLHVYWDLGCSEFMLTLVDQGHDYPKQLEILAGEVLPEFRKLVATAKTEV